jgi:hypothetical protein
MYKKGNCDPWYHHPKELFCMVFPGLHHFLVHEKNVHVLFDDFAVSNGETISFNICDTRKENAHKGSSAYVIKHGGAISPYASDKLMIVG